MVNNRNSIRQSDDNPMQHFAIDRWVDFARGLSNEQEGSAMRAHLASGCSECAPLADFFAELNIICRSMAACTVPDSVLRGAYDLFPPRLRARPKHAIRIPVELIYNSFLAPAPAGLRTTWQVGWQGLYRAGDCSLDLRIEPELRSPRASVIGQVSNHTMPHRRMADVAVCLKSGRSVVAETRSNRFGEFQLEYEQQSRLQLCVYLEDGSRCIQVPIKQIAAEKPAGTDRLKLNPEAGRKRLSTDSE